MPPFTQEVTSYYKGATSGRPTCRKNFCLIGNRKHVLIHDVPYLHRHPLHTLPATLDATSYSMCVTNKRLEHVKEAVIVNPRTNNKVLSKN